MALKNKNLQRVFGSKRVWAIYIVCFVVIIATLIATVTFAIAANNQGVEKVVERIVLCLVAVLMLNIPIFMELKLNLKIPSFINITVAIFIVAHFVLGEIFRFYDHVFLFDKILHLTAGIVISFLGFSIVYGFNKSGAVRLSPFFIALFSFCFCLALLTLWEVLEYAMDSLFSTNMQRWEDGIEYLEDGILTSREQGSGLVDTMTDLIIGMVGAFAVCLCFGILLAKNPTTTRFYITKKTIKRQSASNTTDILDKTADVIPTCTADCTNAETDGLHEKKLTQTEEINKES